MSRADDDRLRDVRDAAAAIMDYVLHGDISDGMVFDAVRMRLVEIGEAVKDVDASRLAQEPGVPWPAIAGMRDFLTHQYFDTDHAIVGTTVRDDIPELLRAVDRLLGDAQ